MMIEEANPHLQSLFDSDALEAHRARAKISLSDHDFLYREIADRLADRLADMNRVFETAADLSPWPGYLGAAVNANKKPQAFVPAEIKISDGVEALDLAPGSVDLILSNFGLHWVNDLPGILVQIRRALKPDGLFLAAMPGGDTLHELRHALIEGETKASGGIAPRVSPFADLADAAALLQRAGFALPVADTDRLTVTYTDPFSLMKELRGMGETNSLAKRPRGLTRRAVFLEAAAAYQSLYGMEDGRIPATFEILFMAGWAPHESQQKPLTPGSAKTRLSDALGTEEIGTGEKPG